MQDARHQDGVGQAAEADSRPYAETGDVQMGGTALNLPWRAVVGAGGAIACSESAGVE